jgi:hypothetical protein
MATEKQIGANRRNAERSTGPRTPEGKAASSRNANRGYGRAFFWDGHIQTLEEQVLQPIQNPVQMDLTLDEASARVGMAPEEIANALATYVRSILSGASPFDRYVNGSRDALTAFRCFEAKATARPATSGQPSRTKVCTTPASPGETAASPTAAPSKPRLSARSPARPPTCTTAAWRRSKTSSASTPAAPDPTPTSIARSARCG